MDKALAELGIKVAATLLTGLLREGNPVVHNQRLYRTDAKQRS